MPGAFRVTQHLAQTCTPMFVFLASQDASRDQQLYESKNIGMLGEQVPVEPTRSVILAVRVIVASLAAAHLIAHDKHGHAHREQGGCEYILDLPVAQPLDIGIVGRSFYAAVPASVVIAAIAIVFAVRLVMFVIVGNEVVERKTVVARREVDALFGFAFSLAVNAGASGQTIGHPPRGIA